MTITRKQLVVALISASYLSTGTASAQQANQKTDAARPQSINQVVGTTEAKPTQTSERPGVVTFAPPTIKTATPTAKTETTVKSESTAKTEAINKPEATPRPTAAAAFELAVVIPAAPSVVKRSATAVEVPAVKRESTALQIPYDLFPEMKPDAKTEPKVEVKADVKKVEPKYESRPVISTAQVGSTFGYRSDPFTGRARFHAGCDIKARWGETVGASLGGIVQYVGWYHGYGNIVIVNHGGGVTTHYAHLSSFDVQVGERVARGQIVGRAGSTGRATSPHLHYELRVDGNPVNPFQPLALDSSSDYFKLQAMNDKAAATTAAPEKADVPKPAIEIMRVP